MIKVQAETFDVGAEYTALKARRRDVGGFALFVGSVRDDSNGERVSAMTLEHYPGMTENALADIETEARARWALADVLIIHRFGRLLPGEDIVLVITAAAHRSEAFAACEFLMDYLKTSAPFWKLEEDGDSTRWVEAKASDDAAAARWKEK
jgi:molybdopterin synthase catalytic subunit